MRWRRKRRSRERDQMSLPARPLRGRGARDRGAVAERGPGGARRDRVRAAAVAAAGHARATWSRMRRSSPTLYRLDRVEEGGARAVTGVRVEPGVYRAPVREPRAGRAPRIEAPSPVDVEFLDLPLLDGDDAGSGLMSRSRSDPGPGRSRSTRRARTSAIRLPRRCSGRRCFGTLLDPLPAATPGRWMRGAVRVRIGSGSLQSRERGRGAQRRQCGGVAPPRARRLGGVQFQRRRTGRDRGSTG